MAYNIEQYLLDRANIHDTVTKLTICYDTQDIPTLIKDVFADEVDVDYTSILGGSPFRVGGSEWSERLGKIISAYDSTQHITTGLVINLPQPSGGTKQQRPDIVTVDAQAMATMVKASAATDAAGSILQNGGLLNIELERNQTLEEKGVNPWRITKYVVIKKWTMGNQGVNNTALSK
ncbi:hypothetical protein QBC46DRAFT_387360 [Diplogelasinospora grovesii]|uniref:SnoaL-like domain-containing protein n=1 Tax=Diplogelasinospora grovesii TaxID=303347 RepID=A0AAN6N6Y4_9PEZI|nr:hypothetical protein QBC46DRAFT_387360 [Diplogelasinospora grovesii]